MDNDALIAERKIQAIDKNGLEMVIIVGVGVPYKVKDKNE